MFAIPDAKVVILFTPRTGSMTLHNLILEYCADRLAMTTIIPRFEGWIPETYHMHYPMWKMQEMYPALDLSEYRMFAFARHPVSWFDSCLKYENFSYPDRFHKNMSPRAFYERTGMGRQVDILASCPWMDTEHEIFNFHDFTNEIIRLFSYLDVDLTPEDVERHTDHNTGEDWDREYTEFQVERIQFWYWIDYHFLEFMGWECDNSLNTLKRGSNFNEFRKADHYLRKSLAPLDAVE